MTYEEFYKERLDKLLLGLLGSDDLVQRWWKGPNLAFDKLPPEEVFANDPKKVISYILQQYSY